MCCLRVFSISITTQGRFSLPAPVGVGSLVLLKQCNAPLMDVYAEKVWKIKSAYHYTYRWDSDKHFITLAISLNSCNFVLRHFSNLSLQRVINPPVLFYLNCFEKPLICSNFKTPLFPGIIVGKSRDCTGNWSLNKRKYQSGVKLYTENKNKF